jgi:flagellar biosynthetic protein FliQ
MDALSGILRESLIVTAVLCFPVLAVATLVGTLVAIAQAATQIQEQTLTLLPKLLAVVAMCVTCGAFGLGLCANLFVDAVASLRDVVR